jgi:multiple sugar transport system substrate-binding protein
MEPATERVKTFRIAFRTFGPFEKAIRREWESFRERFSCGLELDAVAMDHHPLYEELFAREGLKRGDWDVALVNTDWIAEAHQSGSLVDLSARLKNCPPEDFPDGWTPSLLRFQQFGDETLGLPYHDGPECFIYRSDLLDDPAEQEAFLRAHGRPLAVPETWDDFARVARFFTRPDQGLFGTIFAAYPDGHNTVYDICLQLWTRGGELFDATGHMQLNTPPMIDALEFYRAMLSDPSAVHPKCRECDSVKTGMAFARSEVAMMINWFGFAAMCQTIPESKVAGRVAVAPIPRGPGGASVSLNVYWMLAIASGSPHPDVGYQFLRHAMGRTQDKLRTLDGAIGCRKSTWSEPDVNQAIPFYRQMEALHAHARELPRIANFVERSAVIDRMVLDAINTADPISAIAARAQEAADGIR